MAWDFFTSLRRSSPLSMLISMLTFLRPNLTRPFMPDIHQHLLLEFRHHLEAFYGCLHLAPPYHSIEKALGRFASALKAKFQDEQEHLNIHHSLKQRLYHQAFIESGLSKKHRGIIIGLLQQANPPMIPDEFRYLLTEYFKDMQLRH